VDGVIVLDAFKGWILSRDLKKRRADQVLKKLPAKSSVKIPIKKCPSHCLKYPLNGKLGMVAVISGIIAASATKQRQVERVIQEPAPLATLFSILSPLP